MHTVAAQFTHTGVVTGAGVITGAVGAVAGASCQNCRVWDMCVCQSITAKGLLGKRTLRGVDAGGKCFHGCANSGYCLVPEGGPVCVMLSPQFECFSE